MDDKQLHRFRELAEAADSGHWPAYLLAADQDRLVALGEALSATLNEIDDRDGCDSCRGCPTHGDYE